MFKYLIDEIKKMEGSVLALGIDDKLINALKKNILTVKSKVYGREEE